MPALCLVFRTCFFTFLISAAYCGQPTTPSLRSVFEATDVRQQNTAASENHAKQPLKSASGIFQVTPASATHQNVVDDAEPMASEFPDDYEYYSVYDDFNLSNVAPEVLVDLEPLEEMVLSFEPGSKKPQKPGKPIPDGFVRNQEMELLRLHNFYRSKVTPPAADMSFMEWDDDLAKIAQEWAEKCEFRHGFPPNSYDGAMGQNLYMGHDPTGNRAMIMWFEEHEHYSMKTPECVPGEQCCVPGEHCCVPGEQCCVPGEQCGHYTQMVWGESSLVGCGMKRCGFRKFYVVCHYSPPGNIAGSSPYKVGKPCSQCPIDHGGMCTKNSCVTDDQCARNKEDCGDPECPLECHNCGTLNSTTCKCSCADGWDSLDCSRRCRNAHEDCGKRDGAYPSVTYCSITQYGIADVHCREMCGRCRGIVDVSATSTCCNGILCDDGCVIDTQENLCKCKLLCPGPKCYNDSNTLHKTTSDQDSGLLHNVSNKTRGQQYTNISSKDIDVIHKTTSDSEIGTTYESTLNEDSGSPHFPNMFHISLFALIVQTTFLS